VDLRERYTRVAQAWLIGERRMQLERLVEVAVRALEIAEIRVRRMTCSLPKATTLDHARSLRAMPIFLTGSG